MTEAYATELEIRRLALAECVCRRPQMYTAHGALSEVIAWFEGYEMARSHGAILPDGSPSEVLTWWASQAGFERMRGLIPADLQSKIVSHFGSEEAALQAAVAFLAERPDRR